MKDDKDQRGAKSSGLAKNPDKDQTKGPRQDRLKLALRENLKRRKSQARARNDRTIASADNDDVSLDDGSEKKPGG
jgi:hypothetical protein